MNDQDFFDCGYKDISQIPRSIRLGLRIKRPECDPQGFRRSYARQNQAKRLRLLIITITLTLTIPITIITIDLRSTKVLLKHWYVSHSQPVRA